MWHDPKDVINVGFPKAKTTYRLAMKFEVVQVNNTVLSHLHDVLFRCLAHCALLTAPATYIFLLRLAAVRVVTKLELTPRKFDNNICCLNGTSRCINNVPCGKGQKGRKSKISRYPCFSPPLGCSRNVLATMLCVLISLSSLKDGANSKPLQS